MIQMVLSNASIINITLCGHSGDIEKLMIDKSLVGKLSGETVSDGKLFFVPSFLHIMETSPYESYPDLHLSYSKNGGNQRYI